MTAVRLGTSGRLGLSPERRLLASPDVLGVAHATSVASAIDQLNPIDCADARWGA
jgi:hypothetical protein